WRLPPGEENARAGGHGERADLSPHGDAGEEVAALGHQRPHAGPLAPEDQADGAGEIDLPWGLPALDHGTDDPDTVFLQYFNSLDEIRLAGDRQILDGPHGRLRGRSGDPGGVVLGHNGSVRSSRLGRPQDGSQVARILNLVQGQEEGRLAPLARRT